MKTPINFDVLEDADLVEQLRTRRAYSSYGPIQAAMLKNPLGTVFRVAAMPNTAKLVVTNMGNWGRKQQPHISIRSAYDRGKETLYLWGETK